MTAILLQATAMILVIVIAYTLKKTGFFGQQDAYPIISKILMKLTLPANIIVGFAGFQLNLGIALLALIGFGCNIFMSTTGFLLSKKTREEKAFGIINYSGYNIGCLTLPFVQSFLGPAGVVATCMFDAGNCLMCTGGTLAVASAFAGKEPPSLKNSMKKLFSSIPFDTYLILCLLALAGITLPDAVITLVKPIANANAFVAMFMIGLVFEFDLKGGKLKKVIQVLAVRYTCSAVLACLFYFVLPLPLVYRQALVLAVFSPISALAPVFTEKCEGDTALAGLLNSLTIIIAIIALTVLLMLLGLGG